MDLGSYDIIADKATGAENVVRIKSAVKGFEGETNFSVITADGCFYSFNVVYKNEPAQLSIEMEAYDLLSDVMGNAREGNIWITLQTHKNIMAIASLKELAAIVLVKGYRPEEDTVSESEAEGIPILSTSRQTFEMTGEIYELLQKKEQ